MGNKLPHVASQYPLELWQFLDHFDDFQFGVTSDIHLGVKAMLEKSHKRPNGDQIKGNPVAMGP